jgi:SnoaL-like domain
VVTWKSVLSPDSRARLQKLEARKDYNVGRPGQLFPAAAGVSAHGVSVESSRGNTMRTRWSWSGRLVVATVVGCLVQPAWAIELRSDIEAVNAVFASATARGDSAALAALYADDATIMPAASETIVGRDAIQKFWRGALSSGIAHISLKTIELYGGRDHCTEVEAVRVACEDG